MMHVELMKNFLLADSSELLAVRLILASSAKKRLDSYFLDKMYVQFMKNFLFTDSSELMAVRSDFSLLSPRTIEFLLSRHDARRAHEKFSSRRFERAIGC